VEKEQTPAPRQELRQSITAYFLWTNQRLRITAAIRNLQDQTSLGCEGYCSLAAPTSTSTAESDICQTDRRSST
jgi:hypothetical protein